MIVDVKDRPDKEFRYFLYDPNNRANYYYRTAEERDDAAIELLSYFREDARTDGWDESVEELIAGEVTHVVEETDYREKPDTVDEDGYDADGVYWPADFDFWCDYEIKKLEAEK